MTQKRVKASDVIGNSYYIYTLQSSNNTPSLNSTISITCNVTNVYGQAVSGKSITLYQNNTSQGTKTTDSNGNASWNNISMSSAGLQVFKVENSKIEVFVDNKSDVGHTHSQYLTEHQSLSNYVTTDDSRLSDSRTPTSHTHGNLQNNGQVGSIAQANKNVVTDSSGKITTEDKPTIPSASSITPSADTTSGSVGAGTTWARSNHTHPKSSLYAEASHTHSQYLTSHQDISGKEDKSNKVTSWSNTTTDTHYPSEKLVKESIDSVLYETEELELGTPTTSSNVTYTYTRPNAEQDTTFSISTLNTISIPQPSNEMRANIYDYVIDVSFPEDENAILIFGDVYGCALFYDLYDIFIGLNFGENRISGSSVCHPRGNSLDYHLIFRRINNYEYRVFFNDANDKYMDIYIYGSLIKYSDNVSINISAQRMNIPIKLSRYIDDIEKLQSLPDGSDLNFLNEDKIYLGSNDEYTSISHCPVSNKVFFVKNIPLGEFGSGDMYQQTLITLNDGANTEVWVRTQIMTSGYSGTWVQIDNKGGKIYRIVGTETSTLSNYARLHCGTLPFDLAEGKIIVYVVPDISSLSESLNVDLRCTYPSGVTRSYSIKKSNDENLSIGEIRTGDELLLIWGGSNWRLISNSSISDKEDKSNKVTSWSSTPTDIHYPSEKLVKEYVDGLVGSAITYIVGSGD